MIEISTDSAAPEEPHPIQICGPRAGAPSEPDLEGCGTTGVGALAEAIALHEQAVQRIELARARLEAHDARITIQMQRLSTVWGIRQETLEFLDSTNAAINAIQIQRTILQTVVKTLEIASNAQVFNGGAPAAMAAAVAIMGAIDGALGIAQQQLEQAQAMRIRTDDVQVEYVNGMATIQEMLTQMAELAIEVSLSVRDAAIAAMRVATVRARLETVAADEALLRSRVTDSRWNDPTFRVLRDQLAQRALAARERALARVYLAARAFEFQTNTDLPAIETDLVPATSAEQIQEFVTCLQSSAAAFRAAYGAPQSFTDEISLREDVFGIRGPVPDPITGEVISEAEQFRRVLLQPSNLGPDGTVGLSFATSLARGNGLFSTAVCNDQIRTLQIRLIGDGLGDDQARVYLEQAGTTIQRTCDAFRGGRSDEVAAYSVQPRRAELQAGVNTASTAAPDTQFTGRSVAASEWRLSIPPGDAAPANADLDPTRIDDIVIRVEHGAISISESPVSYRPSCGG